MLHVTLYCTLGILAWTFRATSSAPVTYDQRQSGDVNVQIHLKDVQVVALIDPELLDDYTDYDYAYDYADFTIKPIVKPTTATPSTSSAKPWNTWPTNPPTSSTMRVPIATSSPSLNDDGVPETTTGPTTDHETPIESNSTVHNLGNPHENNETDGESRSKLGQSDESPNAGGVEKAEKFKGHDKDEVAASVKKVCPAGYAINKKGRCRTTQLRRRISLAPWTMRLGSKLSEKDRLTVRKDLPIRVYKSEPRM